MKSGSVETKASEPQKPNVRHVIAAFSGPLPPPGVLEEYNRIVPGAANRILLLAEKQADNRRQVVLMREKSATGNSRLGIACGFVIGVAGIAAATVIALYGNAQAGVGMGLLTLGSLVSVFVYGSQNRRKETRDNWERLESFRH